MIDKVVSIEPEDIEIHCNKPDEITRQFVITVHWLDEGKKHCKTFAVTVSKGLDYPKLAMLSKIYNFGIMGIKNYFYYEYLPKYSRLADVILTPLAVNKIYDTVSETY